MTERREAIADAAIEIIGAGGMRALTHRAVDSALDLPPGSTSYYLRTRLSLVEAVVRRLADRTLAGITVVDSASVLTARDAAVVLAGFVAELAGVRRIDQLARFTLLLELRDDAALHALVASASPVRSVLVAVATQVLASVGIPDAPAHAPALIAIADGLVFDRLTGSGGASVDPVAVFEAYLVGLASAA